MHRALQIVRWIGLLLLMGAGQGWSVDALAQGGGAQGGGVQQLKKDPVPVTVRPLFDGLVRETEWATVSVKARNLGPDARGALMFNTQSVDGSSELWSRSVELPKGTTKQWTAYYRPGLGYTDRELSFVMGANSKKIPYQVDSYGNDAVLIGVVGDAAVGINTLRESWRGRVPASIGGLWRQWPARTRR